MNISWIIMNNSWKFMNFPGKNLEKKFRKKFWKRNWEKNFLSKLFPKFFFKFFFRIFSQIFFSKFFPKFFFKIFSRIFFKFFSPNFFSIKFKTACGSIRCASNHLFHISNPWVYFRFKTPEKSYIFYRFITALNL